MSESAQWWSEQEQWFKGFRSKLTVEVGEIFYCWLNAGKESSKETEQCDKSQHSSNAPTTD